MSRELDRIRQALMRHNDHEAAYPISSLPRHSFFSFRYSYTEISVHGGVAQVKSRETRLENGRLVTEECEGTVDADVYDRMADETQRHVADQMTQAMKLFFLPFSAWGRERD